jgi:hypothetical protein
MRQHPSAHESLHSRKFLTLYPLRFSPKYAALCYSFAKSREHCVKAILTDYCTRLKLDKFFLLKCYRACFSRCKLGGEKSTQNTNVPCTWRALRCSRSLRCQITASPLLRLVLCASLSARWRALTQLCVRCCVAGRQFKRQPLRAPHRYSIVYTIDA